MFDSYINFGCSVSNCENLILVDSVVVKLFSQYGGRLSPPLLESDYLVNSWKSPEMAGREINEENL